MRIRVCACILCVAAGALPAAIHVGDTYQKVLKENGRPSGSIEAGTTLSLHYPEQIIKLERGRVVAIEVPRPRASPESEPPGRSATSRRVQPARSVFASGRGGVQPGRWTTEYAAALAAAREQNRRVFLFFTGSDWSSGCMQLQHEIFSTPLFRRYANENLMLVEIDFPKRRKQPESLKAQNEALKRQYGIHVFPIVVVLDSSGQQLGMFGYMEGGPQAFIASLEKLEGPNTAGAGGGRDR